jgi:hypothetical protein
MVYPTGRTQIHPLLPPEQYVVIRPDDMLSVQEVYMTGEGMDTYSFCPACQAGDLHVLSTTAIRQKFGNPCQAIRCFCEHCQSVCYEPAVTPMQQCPISDQVKEAMRPDSLEGDTLNF